MESLTANISRPTNRSRSPPGLSPASAASVSSAGAVSGAPAALVPPIFTIAEDDEDLIAADRGGFQSPVINT